MNAAGRADCTQRLLGAEDAREEVNQSRRILNDEIRRDGVEAFTDEARAGQP
jgi:hypothetical protein